MLVSQHSERRPRFRCPLRAPGQWHTLNVDFVRPVEDRTFLIVVDAHTKGFDVRQMAHTLSVAVISVLR